MASYLADGAMYKNGVMPDVVVDESDGREAALADAVHLLVKQRVSLSE
jgi:hypothetical protein